jgi:hypothetical protein
MTRVERLQTTIEALPEEEFNQLRHWFLERDWEQWDLQIERDSAAGKLDFLIEEARQEKAAGKLKDL